MTVSPTLPTAPLTLEKMENLRELLLEESLEFARWDGSRESEELGGAESEDWGLGLASSFSMKTVKVLTPMPLISSS